MSNPEAAFAAEMEQTYRDAAKKGYPANYFLRMLGEHGAVGAAQRLLAAEEISQGLMKLCELELLDLSVEAVILKPEYAALFTPAERARARERLAALDHPVAWDRGEA